MPGNHMRTHIFWLVICLVCSAASAVGGSLYFIKNSEVISNVGAATALMSGAHGNYETMRKTYDALQSGDIEKASKIIKTVSQTSYSIIAEVVEKMSSPPYNILLEKEISESKQFLEQHKNDQILQN